MASIRIKLKAKALGNYKVLDKHWLLLPVDRKSNKRQPYKEAGKIKTGSRMTLREM